MNWLDRYAAWAAAGGEATEEAHRWGGYAVMAGAIGREVCFTHGPRTVGAHFYLMLVSGAQSGQAEEVARLARRFALRAYAREFVHHATLEGFFEQMREPWGTLLCLDKENWRHWSRRDYGALLTAWAEDPDEYIYRRIGNWFQIRRPRLTILAHTDRPHAQCLMQARGLIEKFLFAEVEEAPRRWPLPPPSAKVERRLQAELEDLDAKALHEGMTFEAVKGPYEEWARAFESREMTPLRAAQTRRFQLSCLKLACFEQIAQDGRAAVRPEALQRAIVSIEQAAHAFDRLEEDSRGADDPDLEKLREIVESKGMIEMPVLRRKLRRKNAELLALAEDLQCQGLIEIHKRPPQCRGGHTVWEFTWIARRSVQREDEPVVIGSNGGLATSVHQVSKALT